MKIFRTGSSCLILLLLACALPGEAQQQPPATPPPAAPPAATPPAAAPRDQEPPEPQPRNAMQKAPPPLPKVTDIRQPGETGWWVGVMGWFPTQNPLMDKGHGATFTAASKTTFQGKPKVAEGAEMGIALGLHNALRLTYFQTRAAGNFTNSSDTRLWSQLYSAGTYLSTNYKLQNAKLSFDYLTWPYPVETRRFRLKTLWQVQYTSIKTGFDAPKLPLADSNGNPIVDSTGNPVDYTTQGTRWYITPTLGLGIAYWGAKNFRFEANAAGFAIPHHTTTWDADASANLRFGKVELRVGAKAFHFQTSTQLEYFMKGTLASGFVGLRWYSR